MRISPRTISRSQVFANECGRIVGGGVSQAFLNSILQGVEFVLGNLLSLSEFSLASGCETIRVLKTEPYRDVPPLIVAFKERGPDEVVLYWIEVAVGDGDDFSGPPIL